MLPYTLPVAQKYCMYNNQDTYGPPIHISCASYKFRQSSDFWYLTGFDEPDAAVILEKMPSCPRGYRMTIFSAGTDSAKEKWDGARTSPEDVVRHFGADEAEPISAFPSILKSLAASASQVYLDIPTYTKRARASSPRSLLKVRSFTWTNLMKC